MQANPTPNSLLFKWNLRRHYACPSSHNDFAGYNVRHLILDSGCTSLLLPITSDADRDQLVALFGDRTQYTWTIGFSGNAGPMTTCSLDIKRPGGSFPVTLCQSTPSPYPLFLQKLRFAVSYVDALALIDLHNRNQLVIVGSNRLVTYVTRLNALVAAIPGATVGERRDYALIGQDVLYGKYVFEFSDLAMVCPSPAQAPDFATHAQHLDVCDDWISGEFDPVTKEFDFIDDEGNHPPEEIDMSVDE